MNTSEIIVLSFVLLFAIVAFVIAYFQFNEKGYLFNNAYIYATKEERSKMNKKPYYRQSAIVFCSFGIIFFIIAISIFTGLNWVSLLAIIFVIFLLVYAIVSSINIARKG